MERTMKEEKKWWRTKVIAERSMISTAQKERFDDALVARILSLPEYSQARTVMAYMAMAAEINLQKLIMTALEDEKVICVPRINSDTRTIQAVPYTHCAKLEPGLYGIMEPPQEVPALLPTEVNLIITPGVVFSESGDRIGYGGGYYDRFLKTVRADAYILGIAYDLQVQSSIPVEPFDKKLDALLTPTRLFSWSQ